MRIFSILAALIVATLMYLAIAERPWLLNSLGMASGAVEVVDPGTESAKANLATAAAQRTLVKVVVAKINAADIDSAVVLRGQTAAARQVDVKAETSAIVVSEPLRKGAQVNVGDALCVLDPGTRGAALDEARARQNEAASRVPESEARVAEARARLEEAQINQNASAKLIKDGFASQTRLASADAAVAAAEAGVSSAQSGLRAALSGIEAAQASVAGAEKEIARLTIKAPFSGLLESDTAELGSLLQPGALCATIIQLDPVKLVAFVPETDVNRVVVGALAGARLAAGGAELRGNVTFLSRSADPTTRTFRVEINVPNADLAIRDGQTAEIMISGQSASAHLVPQSALTLNDEGTLGLRLVDDAAVVRFVPIEIMRDSIEGVWVTGLPKVADVIVVGQEFVTAGVTVAPTWQELSQ